MPRTLVQNGDTADSKADKEVAEIEELQRWRAAEDRAARQNRNLLQYSAAAATILGVGAGSSGLFAVASSISDAEAAAVSDGFFITLLVITLVLAGILALMAFLSLLARADAERASAIALRELIGIDKAYAVKE